jgi:GntR family transcriptional repressor for pyruvate dehydrogenase complex
MANVKFRPLRAARLFERVMQQIEDRIASGALRPGDRLAPERELAEQFQVSRTAIREALRILERIGAIEIRLGHTGGAFIRERTIEPVTRSLIDLLRVGNVTLEDITQARLGIEGVVIEEVARTATEEDLARLSESIARAAAHFDARLELAKSTENLSFHVLIAEATRNPVYRMIVEAVTEFMHPFVRKVGSSDDLTRSTLEFHRQVVAALRDRDVQGARAAMQRHILEVHERVSRSAAALAASGANGKQRRPGAPVRRTFPVPAKEAEAR